MARRMRHTMCRCCAMHSVRISRGSTSARGGQARHTKTSSSQQIEAHSKSKLSQGTSQTPAPMLGRRAAEILLLAAAAGKQRANGLLPITLAQPSTPASFYCTAAKRCDHVHRHSPASSLAMCRCIVFAKLSATSDSWHTSAATSLAPRLWGTTTPLHWHETRDARHETSVASLA